jgi:hypothetical protein
MKREFSDEDIIRFLYDEMEGGEHAQFIEQLYADESLWNRYEDYLEVKDEIPDLSLEPSEQSVSNVLQAVAEMPQAEPAPAIAAQPSAAFFGWNEVVTLALVLITSFTIALSVARMTTFAPSEAIVQESVSEEMLIWEDESISRKLDLIRLNLEDMQRKEVSVTTF